MDTTTSKKMNQALVTDIGRNLFSKLGSGKGEILYTKAALYTQDLSGMTDEQIRALTSLTGEKMTTDIKVADISPVDKETKQVDIEFAFSNHDLNEDINFKSIGLYATIDDGKEEILVAIIPAIGTATLGAGSPDHTSTQLIKLGVAFKLGTAAKINISVKQIGVVYDEDLDAAIYKLKAEYDPKIAAAGKVKGAKINDGAVVEPDDDGILDLIVDSDRIQDLPAGVTDFNNFTESGLYRMPQDVTTINSLANKPSLNPVFLRNSFFKVINDAGKTNVIVQVIVSAVSGVVFARGMRGDTKAWLPWTRVSSTVSSDDVKNMIQSKIDGLNVGQFVKKVNGITPDGGGNVNVTSTVARGFDANGNHTTKQTVENLVGGNQILMDQNAGQDIVNWAKGQFNTLNGNINKLNAKTEIPGVANANDLVGDASSISTYKLSNSGNLNVPDFYPDKRGTLININYDGNAKTQIWIPVGNSGGDSIALRYWEGNNYPKWKKLATVQDTTNLQNQINDLKKSNADLIGTVNWLKDNAAIARRFPASQEAQAQQWENDHPNYFALIEKIDRKKVKAC